MLINPTDFYSSFQVNYYDYKLFSLTHALNNFKDLNLDKIILNYNDQDFIRAIKSEIRQTYFHAIETTFELIFALKPDNKGYINENDIVFTITKSGFPYKEIESISQNPEENLKFLDQEIKLTNNQKVSVSNFIFYRGIYKEDTEMLISEYLKNIKIGLELLAHDFSDRKEYNSYKHGLRPINTVKKFGILDVKTKKTIASWEVSDSMTYIEENPKTGAIAFITKVFDTDRDLKMTSFCSDLIWNIIMLRKLVFQKEKKDEVLPIIRFFNDDIKNRSKINIKVNDLKYTVTPKINKA
jgi:hypothetical protein